MKINKIWAYILWVMGIIGWIITGEDKFLIVGVIAGLVTTL